MPSHWVLKPLTLYVRLSLLYLASCTRPDIAFAVSELSRFVSSPGKPHLEAAKRVFRHLKKTWILGLSTALRPPKCHLTLCGVTLTRTGALCAVGQSLTVPSLLPPQHTLSIMLSSLYQTMIVSKLIKIIEHKANSMLKTQARRNRMTMRPGHFMTGSPGRLRPSRGMFCTVGRHRRAATVRKLHHIWIGIKREINL